MALERLPSIPAAADWLAAWKATGLATDSRRVARGEAFLAWPGRTHDARVHVRSALARGAAACLVEEDGADTFGFDEEPRIAALPGLRAAAGPLASRHYGDPSTRLRVVACTGTNGKTSSAWWTAQALAHLGTPCGVAGTLGIGQPPHAGAPAVLGGDGLTTPDAVALQKALHDFAAAGMGAAAIEASSIGIAEHRLDGTHVDVALFTNFTQDHLDYHGDMAAYWEAKARLFRWPGLRAAVVNVDDLRGLELIDSVADPAVDRWTCSTTHEARLRAADVLHHARGLTFTVRERTAEARVGTGLVGDYNVSNLLGVIAVLRACGHGLEEAAAACAALTPVPGRMQRVGEGGDGAPQVVVDYAHTPDALDKALAALRPLAAERGGRLWCVFGCGGNRDPGKRPLMGAIACRLADHVVVTSDNPRLEPPDFIISQILAGILGHDEVDVIENRAAAVHHAILDAAPADVVLIAGKGHEDYQEVGNAKLPYSDVTEAEAALARRGSAA